MEEHQAHARIFKAFCDPKRLAILEQLRSGEKCACMLQEPMDLTQSGLSYHMKILCDSGIVTGRQEGKWVHYRLNQEGGRAAAELLLRLTTPAAEEAFSGDGGQRREGEMTVEKKTKLYVLTGFLGSGKTTILRRILDRTAEQGARVGVIQNEFGKLSIDGEILRRGDIQMVELNRGSIFCSCLRLNFVQALVEMAAHQFDYLFIESSGLGDPSNVEEILQAAAVLCGDAYEFAGAVCLVDAVNFLDQLGDLETVYRQLKHCHLAVVTKVDLADEEQIRRVEEKLREINPVCALRTSANGDVDLSFLGDDLTRYRWAECEETTNGEETKPKTLFMDVEGPVEREKLEQFLLALRGDLYRAKGFLCLAGEGWSQVDLVGSRVDFQPSPERALGQLVFISRIGPAVIRRILPAWEELVGAPMKLRN